MMFFKFYVGEGFDVRLLDEGLWFGEYFINRIVSIDGLEFFLGIVFWNIFMVVGLYEMVFISGRRN